MKLFYYGVLFVWTLPFSITLGQKAQIDNLKRLLNHTRQDTSRVILMTQLAQVYNFYSSDSSLKQARQAYTLAQRIHFTKGIGRAYHELAISFREQGQLPQSLAFAYKALAIAQTIGDQQGKALALNAIGVTYLGRDDQQAIKFYHQSLKIYQSIGDREGVVRELGNLTSVYTYSNQLALARQFNRQAYQLVIQLPPDKQLYKAPILRFSGLIEERSGNPVKALIFYQKSLQQAYLDRNRRNQSQMQDIMANWFEKANQLDSSLYYANLALQNSRYVLKGSLGNRALVVARLYKRKNNLDSAYFYQRIAIVVNDSLHGPQQYQKLQWLALREQQRQHELMAAQTAYQNSVRLYTLLAGLGVIVLIAFILYSNNRQKQKANAILEKTLSDLRTTQTQLIQREKMASLGELTAGIAHEIQNPLNFVNNFAEVSVELADELLESVQSGQTDSAQELATDLRQNMHHITQNGQRASNIVKGMLEHSRSSTGERLPTNLNALSDEYLRLSYQGLRAKNKDFNCQLETHFDANLPLVSIVASDISRVLINLFNNAFYAVHQRQQNNEAGYQPTVTVSTQQSKGQIKLIVRDNGIGIPNNIKAKVFQPFFTTKPTGQGTGLGLSLSYDIVTKGHGGSMIVESHPDQYTEFMISLPIL